MRKRKSGAGCGMNFFLIHRTLMGYRLDGVPSRKVVTKFKPVNAHVLGVLTFRVHVQKIYIPLQNPECFVEKRAALIRIRRLVHLRINFQETAEEARIVPSQFLLFSGKNPVGSKPFGKMNTDVYSRT